MTDLQEQPLTIQKAARKIGRSPNYVRRLIAAGLLDAFDEALPNSRQRRLRIWPSAIDEFRQARRRPRHRNDIRTVVIYDQIRESLKSEAAHE